MSLAARPNSFKESLLVSSVGRHRHARTMLTTAAGRQVVAGQQCSLRWTCGQVILHTINWQAAARRVSLLAYLHQPIQCMWLLCSVLFVLLYDEWCGNCVMVRLVPSVPARRSLMVADSAPHLKMTHWPRVLLNGSIYEYVLNRIGNHACACSQHGFIHAALLAMDDVRYIVRSFTIGFEN